MRTMMRRGVLGLVIAGFAGCTVTSTGTEPEDMTAAGHETAAGEEEAQAAEHEAQYEPEAVAETERCGVAGRRPCWTSVENPTEEHREQAAEHRALAERHRAAHEALVQAEASACADIPEEDRDMSPFAHRADIRDVTAIEEPEGRGRAQQTQLQGAAITFRAVPGLTEQWLQRVVDCHLARNAVTGGEGMDYCPLALRNLEAKVRPADTGFVVEVRAHDRATAREVLRRAEALTAVVP